MSDSNVKQAVPFFGVSDMEGSLRYYVDGFGFEMKNKWVVDDKIRWCWLQLGEVVVMLQEFFRDEKHDYRPEGKLGQGVRSVSFVRTPFVSFARLLQETLRLVVRLLEMVCG